MNETQSKASPASFDQGSGLTKQQILQALQAWINQRPGLEFGNYGDLASYRSELRSITKDRRDALELLNAVALRDSITAEDLIAAFPRAYSGRLQISEKTKQHTAETCPGKPCSSDCDHKEFLGAQLSYCTGQYWPTEYRRAACAVLASVLWDRARADMPAPDPKPEACPCSRDSSLHHHETYKGKRAGDWLRDHFRRQFGRSIQSRWFD